MKRYLVIFTLLFVTEVAIALFHFHRFVRGFLGDVLVIPLLYTFIRAFSKFSMIRALLATLFIAIVVELLQAFSILEVLGIQSEFLQIILGSTFDPLDLLAYFVGAFVILIAEKLSKNEKN
ncbi:DUF2809 domain-containing protein [Aureisphaera galaxeae]|uniref:ribosomal maturation YjgA family protein n=1 Tax=Aureisphaera galaxeae TaxID=1538023 RepID=UPI00235021CB|nr:DUF2809 domain-containing protein [Aureisphaera galaxeae]MDC8004443.1 DUF2809 domain-containing protein [Aureisphaera galaxeae]